MKKKSRQAPGCWYGFVLPFLIWGRTKREAKRKLLKELRKIGYKIGYA